MISLEKFLFYLLIFCLPFQSRKILYQWGENFNEWSSAYLYLTDGLILAIFFLWFWRSKKQPFLKEINWSWPKNHYLALILIVFLIIAFVSLTRVQNFWLGFYQWLKLLEFILLFFYLRDNFHPTLFEKSPPLRWGFFERHQIFGSSSNTSPQRWGIHLERLAQVFLASAFFQSLIAIGQYMNQQSLGLKFLAESPLSSNIPGVAKIVVDGLKMIRAYGTFPHPNLLATFLCLGLFCLFFIYLKQKPWSKKFVLADLTKNDFLPKNGLLLAGLYPLLLFALFLTFSRGVIFAFVLATLGFFIYIFFSHPQLRTKVIELFLLLIVLCSLFTLILWPEISSRFLISSGQQAVSLRLFYNQIAFDLIKDHPLLGIGLGNFVWQIKQMLHLLASWLHQPVHNIYLLIASEIGLIGLGFFLLFLFFIIKRINIILKENSLLFTFYFCLFAFLIIGLFDHFFWTLQQGQLMFWIILSILSARTKSEQLTNT